MLENLSQRMSRVVKTLRGEARLTETNTQEMLREIRVALLEADVALPVVRELIANIREKALGQEVLGSLTPGQALVGVVNRELTAVITKDDSAPIVSLKVPSGGTRDFVYGVKPATQRLAAFSVPEATEAEMRYEARTYFSDGSRGYDLMGMNEEQVIADILGQFERYRQIVQLPATSLVVAAPEHEPEVTSEP